MNKILIGKAKKGVEKQLKIYLNVFNLNVFNCMLIYLYEKNI